MRLGPHGTADKMQIARRGTLEQASLCIRGVTGVDHLSAVAVHDPGIGQIVDDFDTARRSPASFDRVRVATIEQNCVVQHLCATRRNEDAGVEMLDLPFVSVDEVVADDSAFVVGKSFPLHKPISDRAIAVNERVGLANRVLCPVPHQHGGHGFVLGTRGSANITKEVVSYHPIFAAVHVHAVCVTVRRSGLHVLDDAVFDNSVVHAAALAVGAGFDELFAGVNETAMVDVDLVALWVQRDWMEANPADGHVGDGQPFDILGENSMIHGFVVHTRAADDHVFVPIGLAANRDVVSSLTGNVNRPMQLVIAFAQHDRRIRLEPPERAIDFFDVRNGDHRPFHGR